MKARLAIGLHRAGDGSVVATGTLAVTPYWCRWDGSTLWIVGSAACPVGDDDITLDLRVGDGVTATVRNVAATVVYGGRGEGTRLTTRLHGAAGATLIWQPEPVIVTARARHQATLVADVQRGGTLLADEVVVFGRSREEAGPYRSTTDLRLDGEPICLSSFDTATPGWSGPGGAAGATVVGTRVLIGPTAVAEAERPIPVDPATVVLQPEGGGALATTLAPDPERARAQLAAALPGPDPTPSARDDAPGPQRGLGHRGSAGRARSYSSEARIS